MPEVTIGIFVFLFGICVGSFLNVCIYRMGRELSIVKPRSYCTSCKKPIRWHDNIPLLSYLLLKGRCRNCHKKISRRYFLVEFMTGVLFLAVYYNFGEQVLTPIYWIFISGLIVSTFVDFDFQIIPDEISVGGILLGLLLSFVFPQMHNAPVHLSGLYFSFLGAVIAGGILWVLGCVGDFIFKKESMGGGDIKLLAMIGAFLGWKVAILSLPLASVIGAIVGIVIKIRTKESTIAFGPYLSFGAIVSLFWSDKILGYLFYY